MKKKIAALTLSLIMLTALPLSAYGHSHGSCGGAGSQTNKSYALCKVKDCSISGNHNHSGKTYAGHYAGDGHDSHQSCTVKNCTKTENHSHSGNHNGGRGHH